MKFLIRFSALLFVVLSMVYCKKNDDTKPNVIYKATLSGASEVPPNLTTALGLATLTFNPNTNIFSITVTHNLAAATAGHIHRGAVGVNGEVVFPFLNVVSPINFTSVALNAGQRADLNAGLYYVNLHTASFPDGEIRGQLIKQ